MSSISLSVKVTLPKMLGVTKKDFLTERLTALTQVELNIMRRWFQKTTATWDTPVQFDTDIRLRASDMVEGYVGTENIIYRWVSDPRKRGRVQFSRNYRPKTKPGKIGSSPGSGNVWIRGRKAKKKKTKVEPRLFNLLIAEKREKPIIKKLERAVEVQVNRRLGGKA